MQLNNILPVKVNLQQQLCVLVIIVVYSFNDSLAFDPGARVNVLFNK